MSRRTPNIKPTPAKPSVESVIAEQTEAFALLAEDMKAAHDVATRIFGKGCSDKTVMAVYDRLNLADDEGEKAIITDAIEQSNELAAKFFHSEEMVFEVFDRFVGEGDEGEDDEDDED